MSDEEDEQQEVAEEEDEGEAEAEAEVEAEVEEAPREEEKPKPKPPPPKHRDEEEPVKEMSEAEKALQAQKRKREAEEQDKLGEYEEQRRIMREKEEEELRQLKEKQERRKQEREEEERVMAERRQVEEERRKAEDEARKQKAEAEKARREEEKKKKKAMGSAAAGGANFEIPKKVEKDQKVDQFGNVIKEKKDIGLTKEQHEEAKKKAMENILKPLNLAGMDIAAIRNKVKDLHKRITRLETDRYDLEKRQERQEYDLKELNERQRQIARNKAMQKGLSAEEAESSKHPPRMPVSSKYDRQTDRRSYGDRRLMYEAPKKNKDPKLFHGSARPPNEWGRKETEELETLRKSLEGPKYVEAVKVEGAKPPMDVIPTVMPEPEKAEEEEEE